MHCVAQIVFGACQLSQKRDTASSSAPSVRAALCLLVSNCVQDMGRMLPNMPSVCHVVCAVCMPALPPFTPTCHTAGGFSSHILYTMCVQQGL